MKNMNNCFQCISTPIFKTKLSSKCNFVDVGRDALHVYLDLCMGKQFHHTNGLQLGIQDLNIGRHPDYWEYLCIFNVRLQEI